MKRSARLIIPVLGMILLASACTNPYASSTSDTHVCVFDGSERGGQHLVAQVPPNADSVSIDDNDQVVRIPASNRFYMASNDDNTRDPRAPHYYVGFAESNVEVQLQGQVRFRFNLDLACQWYSQHGRRNADDDGDLGFNARGAEANDSGWLIWLAENFGVTMQEITTEVLGHYDWAAMTFNYPVNADEIGQVPEGQEAGLATQLVLGQELGVAFTARIAANLGAPEGTNFFCGVEVVDDASDDPCPPMRFQVVRVDPTDTTLRDAAANLERERQNLELARQNAELQAQTQVSQIDAATAQIAIREAEFRLAELEALIAFAPCAPFAAAGLDCEGHHPTIIAGD